MKRNWVLCCILSDLIPGLLIADYYCKGALDVQVNKACQQVAVIRVVQTKCSVTMEIYWALFDGLTQACVCIDWCLDWLADGLMPCHCGPVFALHWPLSLPPPTSPLTPLSPPSHSSFIVFQFIWPCFNISSSLSYPPLPFISESKAQLRAACRALE